MEGRLSASLLSLVLLAAPPAAALDEALYAKLLERHTKEVDDLARVRVDYAAIAKSTDWRRLTSSLAATDTAGLGTRDEKLAFWINAYNILAIDMVARHWPVGSIRDVGSLFAPVWKRRAGTIDGKDYTLDEIEHEIVRPMGDPRAHAAVVCASTSCPALPREPLTAERLDAQLDAAMHRWMADEGKGLRLDREAETVHLSKIFDWFEGDFEAQGGALAFAARYAPVNERLWLDRERHLVEVEYLDYDWSVNALR